MPVQSSEPLDVEEETEAVASANEPPKVEVLNYDELMDDYGW